MIEFLSRTIKISTGILVVDNNRKMVSMNRNFIEMWNIPQEIIITQNDNQALELASKQVEDADFFLNSVQKIYVHRILETYDTLKLKDGRIIERSSLPQYLENKYVGRIWKFRDVTQYIFAEESLN